MSLKIFRFLLLLRSHKGLVRKIQPPLNYPLHVHDAKTSLMIKALRPNQWIKNFLLLAAPIAATKLLSNLSTIIFSIVGFICASIIGYLVNDWRDRNRDSLHSDKKRRPFASGELGLTEFFLLLIISSLGVTITCLIVGSVLVKMLALYLVITLSYTFFVKQVPVLEMFWLAFGFLIRAVAGSFVINETPTGWFVTTVFFGSVFLTSCKRLSEKENEKSNNSREVLSLYTLRFLEAASTTFAGITAVMYSLWVVQEHSSSYFAYISILFFSCALFSFLLTSFNYQAEEPESALFRNKVVFSMGFATTLSLFWIFYS